MGGLAFVEKRFVTPAKAGVQDIRTNKISNMLDSGLRRNDGFGWFPEFFNKLTGVRPSSIYISRDVPGCFVGFR
jgi:hypothetical protein